MRPRLYVVLLVVLVAAVAAGVYLRQRARAAKADCETAAAPATPPAKLPGFAVEASCGAETAAAKPAKSH